MAQSPYMMVLGIAQDGGYPQAACNKACCKAVWSQKVSRQGVACIALIDPQSNEQWLFDATPDFAAQHHQLSQQTQQQILTGIFLTHAHIGHYTGLIHLGREVMATRKTKVFAMPKMKTFLENNGPWSQLVSLQNIDIQAIEDNKAVVLNQRISVKPIIVPHRDEFSETVGYQIITQNKKLIFIPDIDKWQKWNKELKTLVTENDVLLLDGTFYQDGEIARPMSEVPHPFVVETMDLLKEMPLNQRNKINFIHLNHTNPILKAKSDEYKTVLKNGYHIAKQNQVIQL